MEIITSSEAIREQLSEECPDLSITGGAGDTKLVWNPADEAEVKAAKAAFDNLKNKGFTFFRTDEGHDGERVDEFSEDIGRLEMKVTAVPRMQGGA